MSVSPLFRQFAFVILFATIIATSAHALSTDITVGYDGVVKSGKWTPVAVSFDNKTSDDIEGVLTANQTNPEGKGPVCSANVTLPGKSKKLYHVYTKLSGYSNTMQVTFVSRNGAVTPKTINLTVAGETDRVVVSVGGRTSRLNFLNGEKLPGAVQMSRYGGGSPADSTINVGSIKPDELSDRPAAYEGIDVLVTNGLTPNSANSRSLQAISMWVASGGTFVVSAGANYGEYSHEFYDDLLPVNVTGLTNLPGISSLSNLGGTAFPAGPVAVAQCRVKPGIGRVLASDSGIPVLIERNYGAGKVIYLALDHQSSPFRDWNGQTEFWKNIIKSSSPGPMIPTSKGYMENSGGYPRGYYPQDDDEGRPAMASVVEQNPSVKTPSLSTIGLFLISYVVALVPVNYFVLKRKRKLEMAWVTTPAIIILFTLGAYAVGYTMKGDRLQLREATIIEASSGSRYARAVTNASLFSPARRSYNIEVSNQFALAQSIAAEDGEKPSSGYLADNLVIDDMPMAMWSSKTIESVAGMDLGGTIESDLVVSNGWAKGTVRNNTEYVIESCVVMFGNNRMDLGTLPKGGSTNIQVQQVASQQNNQFYSSSEKVEDRLRSFAESKAASSDVPMLVGIIRQDNTFTILRNRPSVNSASCCMVKLGYRVAGAYSIQPGAISGRTEKMEYADVQYYEGNRSVNPGLAPVDVQAGGWFINSYNVPVPTEGRISQLRVEVASGNASQTQKMKVSLQNISTGNWDEIDAGKYVTNAGSYVSSNGEVRVKVVNKSGGYANINLVLSAVANSKELIP